MKSIQNILFILVLLCSSCQKEMKREYFANGQIKSEAEYKGKQLDGEAKNYYESGQLKYVGTYKEGKRLGKHLTYYPNGVLQREYEYLIENGKEQWVSKKEYGGDGLLRLHSTVSRKRFSIAKETENIAVGDTVFLNLRLLNPSFENCTLVTGPYDKYLDYHEDWGDTIRSFYGNQNHEIRFWTIAKSIGDNKVVGSVKDFAIKPLNDTLGYTYAEDSYFEYVFQVNTNQSK